MGRMCVADLEADGLLDQATQVWCGVFKDWHTKEVFKFTHVDEMLDFMSTCDILAMHNGVSYDWPLLEKLYGYTYEGKKIDTLLMSRLQNPERPLPLGCTKGPHSVEAWGMRFGRHKPEHEDWSKFSPEMLHRCTEDVEIQYLILKRLMEEGKGGAWKQANILTRDVFEILHKQEEYGWLVDKPYMEWCIEHLTKGINKLDRIVEPHLPYRITRPTKSGDTYAYYKNPFTKAGKYQHYITKWHDNAGYDPDHRIVGGPFSSVSFQKTDLGSDAQIKEYLLGEGWIPEQWNYSKKTGERTGPKLSKDESFEGVNSKIGKQIACRVIIRHRRSQLEGMYAKIRPDGRLPQVITGICTTGRLKHSVIVNIPGPGVMFGKQMRKCFIAKPGYKIVGVDSAGCQNRMLAARVGDPAFTKILIEGDKSKGTSIHQVNQRAIKEGTGWEPSYKISKNLNYAFMFGARDKKLGSTAGGRSEAFGLQIRDALLGVSPGFKGLVDALTAQWESTARVRQNKWGKPEYYNGYVIGADGRPVVISTEHKILVFTLQSDEAILMQTALVLLYKWLTDLGWEHGREYGFVANVHDEIQAEVREDLTDIYCPLAEKAITEAGLLLNIACPHVGEADVGDNWYETH